MLVRVLLYHCTMSKTVVAEVLDETNASHVSTAAGSGEKQTRKFQCVEKQVDGKGVVTLRNDE